MKKRYVLFAPLAYAFPILRPLQAEIRRRGDEAAWYLEPECPDFLQPDEKRLASIGEVRRYAPFAVFSPVDYVYDLFPGIKVSVFHGYPIFKRTNILPGQFRPRGWFDIYCSQGPSSTPRLLELERKHGYFKVYETGWCKTDAFMPELASPSAVATKEPPTVLYSSTFTRSITSAATLFPVIERLAETQPWQWLVSFHPKFSDAATIARYQALAARLPNVAFTDTNRDPDALRRADVLLCDASSIIVEFMLHNKPVVTFRNTAPGPHLLNVTETADVEPALRRAFLRPDALMAEVRRYADHHERYRDASHSARVLDAVDHFAAHHQGRLKRKPLNLFRKLKLRWNLVFSPHRNPL